jgi:hypothetical protein
VRTIAPATLILTNNGTRRRAALAGISAASREYAVWTRQQMLACLDLIFSHGVQHIFTPVMTEYNFDETTAGYREQLVAWIDWGIAGVDALADYNRRGWQARLLGAEFLPELAATADRLREQTAHNEHGPCLWFMALPHPEASWEQVLRLAGEKGLTSRQALIREIYGQDVPLATLYLGSGKPQVFPSIVPPLLMGRVDCYWRQHLGYDLDAATLRAILYDYAYLRNTWQEDKTGRAEQVLRFRTAWENPPVIGAGVRLGPFWYPAPIDAVQAAEEGASA